MKKSQGGRKIKRSTLEGRNFAIKLPLRPDERQLEII
jgi:hypothetical protein